jgi:translation initiation factor IF-3
VPEVRLIDNEGNQIGVLKTPDALVFAQERDLDLVEVAPEARPPVCRVLDYSKYKYEQAQKVKQARKHQQQITVREIKFRPKIAQHDYDTKKGHVERFLRHKDKVKVTIMFRGREVTHPERGVAILDRLAEELAEFAVVEQRPLQDGRNMTMMLGPSKAVLAGQFDKLTNGAVPADLAEADAARAAAPASTNGDVAAAVAEPPTQAAAAAATTAPALEIAGEREVVAPAPEPVGEPEAVAPAPETAEEPEAVAPAPETAEAPEASAAPALEIAAAPEATAPAPESAEAPEATTPAPETAEAPEATVAEPVPAAQGAAPAKATKPAKTVKAAAAPKPAKPKTTRPARAVKAAAAAEPLETSE